jgi:hypothetical protein
MPLPYPTDLIVESAFGRCHRHSGMLPQSRTLRSVVKQAYGVEARAAAREGPERVQKPTNKRSRGEAQHEWPVGRVIRSSKG